MSTATVTRRRPRIVIPELEVGQQSTHEATVSARALREYDRDDDSRAQRAADAFEHAGYSGTLTVELLRAVQPLLDEPINPRHVVSSRGHEMTVTGVRSLQVQIDRLREVLGPTHYRLLPVHSADGRLCRMHVVIGNDLQWARVDQRGELVPYTPIEGGTARESEILAHADGWGGHSGGFMPGDSRKGAETNAGKRVIARLGPAREIYRLDFEDNPSAAPEPAPPVVDVQADRPAPDLLARVLTLHVRARAMAITDAKIKTMLVAAGAVDTSDILAAITSLDATAAALFEGSLRAAVENAGPQ